MLKEIDIIEDWTDIKKVMFSLLNFYDQPILVVICFLCKMSSMIDCSLRFYGSHDHTC